MNRNILIIRDGATDFKIIKKLVSEIARTESMNLKFHEIDFAKLDKATKEYFKKARQSSDYNIFSQHAKKLKGSIFLLLNKVFEYYLNNFEISSKDIFILHDDIDIKLDQSENYFKEWAHSVIFIFQLAIQEFYNEKVKEYSFENLPLILPLLFFPSTEILIIAFKNKNTNKFENERKKEAWNLKQAIYQTTNLHSLSDSDLEKYALNYIKYDSLNIVFNSLPEIRNFLIIMKSSL